MGCPREDPPPRTRGRSWTRATRRARSRGTSTSGCVRTSSPPDAEVASIEAAAFERALREGAESERALRWQEAADLYGDLSRMTQGDPRHALALLRYGNALMELRRWDDARAAIDDALREAKAAGDGLVMAQALLAAGGDAPNREDFPTSQKHT